VLQGTGLHGKEEENFDERANLVVHLTGRPGAGQAYSSPVTNRPQDVLCPASAHCRPAWWLVWALEAPGYPIGRQAQRLWKQ